MSLYLKIQGRNLVTFLVWVVSMEVSDLANNLMDSDLLDNNHTGNRVMDRRHTDSSHTASNLMDNNRTCNNHLATGLTDKWHLVSSMDSSHLHNSLMLNNHNTVSNKDMGSKCSLLDKLDSLAVSLRWSLILVPLALLLVPLVHHSRQLVVASNLHRHHWCLLHLLLPHQRNLKKRKRKREKERKEKKKRRRKKKGLGSQL